MSYETRENQKKQNIRLKKKKIKNMREHTHTVPSALFEKQNPGGARQIRAE